MKPMYVLYSNYGAFTPKICKNFNLITTQLKSPTNPVLMYEKFSKEQEAKKFLYLKKGEQQKVYQKRALISNKIEVKESIKEDKENHKIIEKNNPPVEKSSQKKDKPKQKCSPSHSKTNFFDQFLRLPFKVRNDDAIMNLFKQAKLSSEVDPQLTYFGQFDGCCKGNPGLGGVGYLINCKQGGLVLQNSLAIGNCTNNVAQFQALMFLLTDAYCNNIRKIKVSGDSKLVIEAMSGNYHLSNNRLIRIYQKSRSIADMFKEIQFTYFPRIFNERADFLANKGLRSKKNIPKPLPQETSSQWKQDETDTQTCLSKN